MWLTMDFPLMQAPDVTGWLGYILGPGGVLVGLVIVVRAYDSGRIVRREDHERQLAERDARIVTLEAEKVAERERGDRAQASERERTDKALALVQELLPLTGEAVSHAERAVETAGARRPAR